MINDRGCSFWVGRSPRTAGVAGAAGWLVGVLAGDVVEGLGLRTGVAVLSPRMTREFGVRVTFTRSRGLSTVVTLGAVVTGGRTGGGTATTGVLFGRFNLPCNSPPLPTPWLRSERPLFLPTPLIAGGGAFSTLANTTFARSETFCDSSGLWTTN
jgi:hypothetical protein